MRTLLERFAAQYAYEEDKLTGHDDDQSSIHYPSVYLFVGDKTETLIQPMMDIHHRLWENSAGVMYVHVGTKRNADGRSPSSPSHSTSRHANGYSGMLGEASAEEQDRTTRIALQVEAEQGQSKTYRHDLYQELKRDAKHLYQLNRELRLVSMNIAEYGRLYASFDRIHLHVITRVDDPLNVFLPELSILANTIFGQSFKSVQMDLHVLIREREQIDSFGYTSAVGMAFLRELELMQSPNYSFKANLHMTEDGIAIPVSHEGRSLFDLVYVLSDKDERGISLGNDAEDDAELISHIGLLKNRKLREEGLDVSSGVGQYNNTSFKNNLMNESGEQGYVSAGFSKVKRPNVSIALTVLYHFFCGLEARMSRPLDGSVREKLALLGVDTTLSSSPILEALPGPESLEHMNSMMTHPVSFGALKRMSLAEAEEALFGQGCEMYFQDNIAREAQRLLTQYDASAELKRMQAARLAAEPDISFYHLYGWTDEHHDAESVMKELQSLRYKTSKELDDARAGLDQLYAMRVEDLSFQRLPLMDKHNVRSFIRAFFDTVYVKKLEIVRLETELALLRDYEHALIRLHEEYKHQVKQMELLRLTIKERAIWSIRQADDYIGQNLMEYYEKVTAAVMEEIEKKRGPQAFFDERLMGNVTLLLQSGTEALLERLMLVCRREILTQAPFKLTFEEELLQRANVAVDYDNREVLAKDDLFKKLYRTLEDHAGIRIRLLDYTHEHRYEEKYFFGDTESEFVRFALHADETSRIYKLGAVHENRKSGVEKLNLMGGFQLSDLLFYRNGKVYYDSYEEHGYQLHGVEPEELPRLR
ncbi:transcription initiation factor TFIID [Paenibacillus sp. 1001270B_150601_E10]|uniref:transcription initiation factor TFIID n=1 Tax=Paenibacillus sp. 1001270B_150601_E10 TaxID=2787079 RepID=UPI00189E226A|nr:transcription initiation factor TFIID [Paenibacillus sp. 1001270B_150601_E10]